MGFMMRGLNPVMPMDPLSATVFDKLPRGLQTAVNPMGTILPKVVGTKAASAIADPLGVNALAGKEGKKNTARAFNMSESDYDEKMGGGQSLLG